MGLFNDDMTGLAAAYASMNDGKYLLTNADKVGNTPAWQNRYKINETTGQMLYEMADHLKESYEEELIARLDETLAELARLDEGKIPAGLQAYIDKKKGGKKEKEEENGKDHGGSKGSKPDFLDLDKDGDKKEPMKKAAKEKKEETEYNYVEEYLNELKLSPKEKEGLNKSVKAAVSKAAPKIGLNRPEAMRFEPKEELIKSGVFTEHEITKLIWNEFDSEIDAILEAERSIADRLERKRKLYNKTTKKAMRDAMETGEASGHNRFNMGRIDREYEALKAKRDKKSATKESREYSHNPEKYHDSEGHDKKLERDKPYHKRSRAARMADPDRGINSPAFKKFMADRGM